MAGRWAFIRTLFRSWWVRAAALLATILAFVNGYAGVQDQFPRLPKLQDVISVPHLGFLPWWGWFLVWLFVLQTVFVYALFEYVRVRIPTSPPPANRSVKAGVLMPAKSLPRLPPSTRANLGSWDHVDSFTVEEAASLWAGIMPGGSYLNDKMGHPDIAGAERLILTEVPLDFRGNPLSRWNQEKASVSRKDLMALAEAKGVRPSFLYPEG